MKSNTSWLTSATHRPHGQTQHPTHDRDDIRQQHNSSTIPPLPSALPPHHSLSTVPSHLTTGKTAGKTVHTNAVTHEAAHPEQHKAKVTAMATRLAELPKAEAGCQEERERVLAANRMTAAGRSENACAGWSDGGRLGGRTARKHLRGVTTRTTTLLTTYMQPPAPPRRLAGRTTTISLTLTLTLTRSSPWAARQGHD